VDDVITTVSMRLRGVYNTGKCGRGDRGGRHVSVGARGRTALLLPRLPVGVQCRVHDDCEPAVRVVPICAAAQYVVVLASCAPPVVVHEL
jgi:hypothetical protein